VREGQNREGQDAPLQGEGSLPATAQQTGQPPQGGGLGEQAVAVDPISEEVQAAMQLARAGGNAAEEGLTQVVRRVFKHQQFRGQQLGIIQKVLQGHSTLAILPTGESPMHCHCRGLPKRTCFTMLLSSHHELCAGGGS